MSIEVNNKDFVNRRNIKGLVTELSWELDRKMRETLDKSEFSDILPADGKVFITISRERFSLSEYARLIGVSRQAIHKSVNRLEQLGVIQLVAMGDNQRDKTAEVTVKGKEFQQLLLQIFEGIEQDMIDKIGEKKFGLLKDLLIEVSR